MSSSNDSAHRKLSTEQLEQLDRLASEFEQQLRRQTEPSIQDFVDRIASPLQELLFCDLVAIELELCDPDQREKRVQRLKETYKRHAALIQQIATANNAAETETQTATPDRVSKPKEMIGPYRLLEQIGQGGMGTVWLAEQREPIRRRVALKLASISVDSHSVIARFEAERQALSMMSHENIAKILDAGMTNDGWPYFAMEYVRGLPITKYCDEKKLSIEDRLGLFINTCKAVQHAHQKGIIHRDIKPGNVLVTERDGKPIPKVIDFGLAKALQPELKLTDKTLYTQVGAHVGTILYMSPEQAENSADVDTRTDVYSLGVLLYELLTGSTPIDRESLGHHAVLRLIAMMREIEPPKPSQRLSSSSGKGSDAIGERRSVSLSKLQKLVQGDLDWIVMKALEKDRSRRYETANGFADDVERFLTDEAVLARPPSSAYRIRKFVRKNWVGVATAVGVVAAILTVATVSSLAYFRVDQERRLAVAARFDENKARQEAELSAKRSAKILEIVNDSFQATNPEKGAQSDMLAKDVLIKAKASLDISDLDNEGRTQFLAQLSTSFRGVGEYELAIQTAEHWRDLTVARFGSNHLNTSKPLHVLGSCLRLAGRIDEAILMHEKALRLRKKILGVSSRQTISSMHYLANAYRDAGRFKDSIKLDEMVLEKNIEIDADSPSAYSSMNSLANSYLNSGQLDKALPLYQRALNGRKIKLGPNHPYTIDSMSNLATAYQNAGRVDDAILLYKESLQLRKTKLGSDHPKTISAMNNLAVGYGMAGRIDEAISLLEQALRKQVAKLGEDHPSTLYTISNLANGYYLSGRTKKAIQLLEKALPLSKSKLGADHPDTLLLMHNLAASYDSMGRSKEANQLNKQTLQLSKKILGVDHPDTLEVMSNLASGYGKAGQFDEAIQLYDQAFKLSVAKLGHDHPTTFKAMNGLIWNLFVTAKSGADLRVELVNDFRQRVDETSESNVLRTLAVAEYRLANFDRAVDAAQASIKQTTSSNPTNFAILAMSYRQLGHSKKASEAREQFDKAMKSVDSKNDPICRIFVEEVCEMFINTARNNLEIEAK